MIERITVETNDETGNIRSNTIGSSTRTVSAT